MDKQNFTQTIETLKGIFPHGFNISLGESQNDKVRTARFVLDSLHRTAFIGDMFNVLFSDGQASLQDAFA